MNPPGMSVVSVSKVTPSARPEYNWSHMSFKASIFLLLATLAGAAPEKE